MTDDDVIELRADQVEMRTEFERRLRPLLKEVQEELSRQRAQGAPEERQVQLRLITEPVTVAEMEAIESWIEKLASGLAEAEREHRELLQERRQLLLMQCNLRNNDSD